MHHYAVRWIVLFAGGALAGTLGGLLGIGGGIVLMPLLRFVLGQPPAPAAGTCVLAVFFTTLGGSLRHLRRGLLDLRSIVPLIASGAAACVIASLLFGVLARRGHLLDLGIGLVFCVVSARMIAEGLRHRSPGHEAPAVDNVVRGPVALKLTIGTAAGVLPGLLGIGTGGVLVPAITFLLKTPIKTAMAASLTCFCINAAISAAFKAAQGFVALDLALPLCVGTLLGANLGATLNHRFSSEVLRLLFGLVFLYVSFKFIFSFFFGVKT